jgi:hypothetical protein
MDLAALKLAVSGLADKSHNDKIVIFGWWLHTFKGKVSFSGADIRKFYSGLHLAEPSSFGGYIKNLLNQKKLLKEGSGYKLEIKAREKLNTSYGKSEITIKVNNLLTSLADTIPDIAERAYYKEALICYNHGSLRAAIVMIWNVAFSHLCDYVLAKRLTDFNVRWQVSFPGMHKKQVKTITTMDDITEELKESEVLSICRDASIITKNIYNSMHAALGKRNAAAHPSSVVIDQIQTDAYIVDIITNVVQKIA